LNFHKHLPVSAKLLIVNNLCKYFTRWTRSCTQEISTLSA